MKRIKIKSKRKLINVFLIILIMVSMIFVSEFSVVVHENVHKFQYRNIPKVYEEICYNNCGDGNAGYYFIKYYSTYDDDVAEISKTTEIYAYSSNFAIWIIYLITFLLLSNKYYRFKN